MEESIWSERRTAEAVQAYYRHDELIRGDRASRLAAAEHEWAPDAVSNAASEGTLPLAVLDALLHGPGADHAFRIGLGAGPIEDLLTYHSEPYADLIGERCRTDPAWATAVGSVWLGAAEWLALPEPLRALVAEPAREVQVARRKPHKRPSKRQHTKPR